MPKPIDSRPINPLSATLKTTSPRSPESRNTEEKMASSSNQADGRATYILNRPCNISVPSGSFLGLPSGLSPREDRAREKNKELAELAAVARMLSGEAAPMRKTSTEVGVARGDEDGKRLSPGIRMPGSPGFKDEDLKEWERRGLDMLE